MQSIIGALQSQYYTIVDLLNDHYHIQDFHKQNNDDFHFIFEQINLQNTQKGCSIEQCEMAKRNNLSSYSEYISMFHGLSNMDDLIYIQILDKIHNAYFHCYDLFRFSPTQNKQLQLAVEAQNKSQNKKNNDKDRLLHQSYYRKVSQFMKLKNHNLKQLKGKQMLSKLTKYSTFADDFKIGEYQEFGNRYTYEESKQNAANNMEPGSHGHSESFVQPRFHNLKQELLNNEKVNISNRDWDLCLRKCERFYFFTNKLRSFQRKIDMESMLSLEFFVNFEHLQRRFKATYFRHKSEYHSDFCCFARILSNAVGSYGINLQDYHFYHGLIVHDKSMPINLNDIYIRFHCPVLTTSRFEVMHNYQQDTNKYNGIILNISNCNNMIGGNTRFIDTAWFAKMECEEQQIFFAPFNTNPLLFRIASVVNLENSCNYYYYLNAINLVQHLINTEPVSFHLSAEVFEAMVHLIESRTRPQTRIHFGHDMIDLFKLFDSFCNKPRRIKINQQQMTKMFSPQSRLFNKFLCNFLLNQINKKFYVLNMENMMKLFPNLTSLSLSKPYLDTATMANALKCVSKKESHIEHIDFNEINFDRNVKNTYQSADKAVKEFQSRFESHGYHLEVDSFSNVVITKEQYDFELTESFTLMVTIRDPRFTSMDYHTMHINTYQQDVYELHIRLENGQEINADCTYKDLAELHAFMTKKHKGADSLKLKAKLPSNSNSFKGGNKNSNHLVQQQKIETYLKVLIKTVLQHTKSQIYKKKLYSFITNHY